jgi:hypothetical protein
VPVVEEDAAGKLDALAHLRQRLDHSVVPEQQLQQQRQVADDLDIPIGEFRDEKVFGKPRDSDDETQDCRKNDTDGCNKQRVDQANPEGPAIA